jgi:hypothetical protein
MPKRVTQESLLRRETDCKRVKLLLDHRWRGSQTEMAADLGVTQSLVSKIVRGFQGPGRPFLEVLARQPGVNPQWVLYGEGQPFPPPTKGSLPIAVGILPGWPEHHRQLLTGERHPVAEAFEKASRYWIMISATSKLLTVAELALLSGDLLLFDADTTLWRDRLPDHLGKLFGVRLSCQASKSYEFGCLQRDGQGFWLDLFDEKARLAEPAKQASEEEAREAFHKQFQRPKRKIVPLRKFESEQETLGAAPPSPVESVGGGVASKPAQRTGPLFFTADDLVALRVYSVRL